MKYLKKIVTHRVTSIVLGFFLQLIFLTAIVVRFTEAFVVFYGISVFISLLAVIFIMNNRMNPAYKLTWVIPIMALPILGGYLYLLFGLNYHRNETEKRIEHITNHSRRVLGKNDDVINSIEVKSFHAANQSRYIQNSGGYPPYAQAETLYFEDGEQQFSKILEHLETAQEFIFMEYFIISEGIMWQKILDILKEKAAQGVDVRLIYDDAGCLFTLPKNYDKTLKEFGIKVCVFNPLRPLFSPFYNNRDHRKMTVVDGRVAFTGGINIADEYINKYEKYGHWKDSGIMIKGDVVNNMTVMFLQLWQYLTKESENVESFLRKYQDCKHDGYVQPFSDSPLDHETVGENVYLNLINKAKRYVYITTPYLVLDNETVVAMTTAAKSGVDIRIITPHIPDKKIVHDVTRSFYEVLIESGVRIYEYTPGFIHSKNFVSDDRYGVVGTINMDYRSLYLHFECGVWIYQNSIVSDIKSDFMETLKVCNEVSYEEAKTDKKYRSLKNAFFRLFAPFL